MLTWISEPRAWQTPHLTLRLRLRAEVTIIELPDGGLEVAHVWGVFRIAGLSPAIASTLKRLAYGWLTSEELLSIAAGGEEDATAGAATAGAAAPGLLAQYLWALHKIGFLLRVQLTRDGLPLLTVEPVSCSSALEFPTSQSIAPRLSRFAYLRRHAAEVVVESGVAAHRVILHQPSSVAVVHALMREEGVTGEETCKDDVSDGDALSAAIDLFDAAGLLEGRERVPAAAIGEELLRMGEFHDLLFHRRSRFGRHDEPFGAEFPFRDEIASPPPIPRPIPGSGAQGGTLVPLPSPSADDVRARDLTLTEALELRVSRRDYGSLPLTLEQIGEFLFRCARVRGLYGPAPEAGMPYEAVDKPCPSGGGMHDLELYLIVHHVEGLPEGAYHYAADRHALEAVPARSAPLVLLLQSAMRASAAPEPPQVLIKIASRFARMSWKYRSISYATTLKNVGVLYQTMYLVATSMRLAACALGSGDDVAAEQALSLSARSEIAVGEFMLGTPAAGPARSLSAQVTWRPLVDPQWGRD